MSDSWRDTTDAVLNAVVGDYLDEQKSGAGIAMAWFDHGRPLARLPAATTRVVVLVHGMACTERCWSFADDVERDYARSLAGTHGLTPLYVRYNSGLPIWRNGEALSRCLAALVKDAPTPVEEITLIGHSMGGLVIRSACAIGRDETWCGLVRRAFYVGTPHLGAPLERVGRVATSVMKAINDPVVQLIGDVASLRSAAIKDLGDGDITETPGGVVPLDKRFEHYFVAGTLGNAVAAQVVGDGMVPVSSASGPVDDHTIVFPGLAHMTLAHHPDVEAWITERAGAPREPVSTVAEVHDPSKPIRPYVDLLHDAVGHGASSIQGVHESIAARTYDILEQVPPISSTSRAVRAVHFGVLRGTYAAVRLVNEMVRSVRRDSKDEQQGAEPSAPDDGSPPADRP